MRDDSGAFDTSAAPDPVTLKEVDMAANKLPDPGFVRECLDYDPDTGAFTWRDRPQRHFISVVKGMLSWNAKWAGKPAGSVHRGARGKIYWTIRLDGAPILAHRLAWLLMRGDPGQSEIDHIDGDPLNNRIANLRLATRSEQRANARRFLRGTITGVKGVTVSSGRKILRYDARVTVNGVTHYLGCFDTIEEAAEVRRRAAIALHGEFHREE
jgi:hypothetical protein